MDAMLLQTSNPKLRERALQEDMDFEKFLKLGIAKEQSVKGAAQLELASGQTPHSSTEVDEIRRLRTENKKLRQRTDNLQIKDLCSRCGYGTCKGGDRCPAMGEKCSTCKKPNHFPSVCNTKRKPNPKKPKSTS